jgi:hypothetical protein
MLVENSDRGFPSHMNLAMADRNKTPNVVAKSNNGKPATTGANADVDSNASDEESVRIVRRLKDQNHQLTEVHGTFLSQVSLLTKGFTPARLPTSGRHLVRFSYFSASGREYRAG